MDFRVQLTKSSIDKQISKRVQLTNVQKYMSLPNHSALTIIKSMY